jgi:DNA invertase Pin-like site-specific DNA recombinase
MMRDLMIERAQREGALIERVYDEGQVSGRKFVAKRPVLAAAIAHCKRVRGTLVFYSLSRLGRSAGELHRIKDELIGAGCELLSVKENIDSRTPMGRAMFGMLATFAELEVDWLSDRTTDVLQAKKARGERVGTIPYGQRLKADGEHIRRAAAQPAHSSSCVGCLNLEPDPDEMKTLREIARLSKRFSYREIAEQLNARGVKPKSAAAWTLHTVRLAHIACVEMS